MMDSEAVTLQTPSNFLVLREQILGKGRWSTVRAKSELPGGYAIAKTAGCACGRQSDPNQ